MVLDNNQRTESYTPATFLHNRGVPVFIDSRHAIQHNKVILIHGETVITGSFNFSKAAEERNPENVLVIRDAGTRGEVSGELAGASQPLRDVPGAKYRAAVLAPLSVVILVTKRKCGAAY